MSRTRPRDLKKLIGGQKLQRFTDFTEQYRRWQQLLHDCLQSVELTPLRDHCHVLAVRANTLVLEASTAAVASRLKLQQHRIITYFSNDAMPHVNSLEVQIKPQRQAKLAEAPVKTKELPKSESDTVTKLRQQAQLCEEPLRSQLLALADKYEQE